MSSIKREIGHCYVGKSSSEGKLIYKKKRAAPAELLFC